MAGQSVTAKVARGEPVEHAFVWQDGKMTDLGALPGATSSYALEGEITNRGQILGKSKTKSGWEHAVVWTLKRG